jgi:hypothetical protein
MDQDPNNSEKIAGDFFFEILALYFDPRAINLSHVLFNIK